MGAGTGTGAGVGKGGDGNSSVVSSSAPSSGSLGLRSAVSGALDFDGADSSPEARALARLIKVRVRVCSCVCECVCVCARVQLSPFSKSYPGDNQRAGGITDYTDADVCAFTSEQLAPARPAPAPAAAPAPAPAPDPAPAPAPTPAPALVQSGRFCWCRIFASKRYDAHSLK